MTLDEYLKQVRDLESKASKAPWTVEYLFGSKDLPVSITHGDKRETILEWSEDSTSTVDDIEFIAVSRSDIPKLLKMVEVMRDALIKIKDKSNGFTFYQESTEALEAADKLLGEK